MVDELQKTQALLGFSQHCQGRDVGQDAPDASGVRIRAKARGRLDLQAELGRVKESPWVSGKVGRNRPVRVLAAEGDGRADAGGEWEFFADDENVRRELAQRFEQLRVPRVARVQRRSRSVQQVHGVVAVIQDEIRLKPGWGLCLRTRVQE